MKIFLRNNTFFIALLLGVLALSCKKLSSYDYPPSTVSLYDILKGDNQNFSTFKSAIDYAGLKDMLSGGDYTLLAPTNAALAGAGVTSGSMYIMPKDSLTTWVKNHLIAGKVDVAAMNDGQVINTLGGMQLLVQKKGSAIYINGGDLIRSGFNATNGTLNIINNALINRQSIIERLFGYVNSNVNAQYTYLVTAINRASQGSTDFVAMLGDSTKEYTLFAPNNGAFNDGGYATLAAVATANPDVLGTLLKYHIIQGRKFTPDFDSLPPMTAFSGDNIYFDKVKTAAYATTATYAEGIIFAGGSANMFGGKGVIHTVPRFLKKPINSTTLARIQSDTSLSFFSAAITRASQSGTDFVKMLSAADSSFTVFAVTNNGFRAAGYTTINTINTADPQLLTSLLQYHMVPKRINNFSVATSANVATLLVSINNANNMPFNNTIRFVTVLSPASYGVQGTSNTAAFNIPAVNANIVTTNGLLNIIGGVLRP